MKTVMISGSRSIRFLPPAAIESLDRIINLELPVIIGDAPGIDSLVQQYLRFKNYQKVTVYFAAWQDGSRPRNTHGYRTVAVWGSYGDGCAPAYAYGMLKCVLITITVWLFGTDTVEEPQPISNEFPKLRSFVANC